MSKTKWFLTTLAVILVSVGTAWLSAAPVIDAVDVNPAYVVINTPTQVLFTARIIDPAVIPTGVNLLSVDAGGKALAVIGVMRDDATNGDVVAGDTVFSYRFTLNPTGVGQLHYRVSAAFRRVLQRAQS